MPPKPAGKPGAKGPKAPPKPGPKKGPPPAMLAKLKAQMAAQKAAEEAAKQEELEIERKAREEERILAEERRREEAERERQKELDKKAEKVAKASAKIDAKREAIERMAAAGMLVPNLAPGEGPKMPKFEKKKKAEKVVESSSSEDDEPVPVDQTEVEDWEQLLEMEDEYERAVEERVEKQTAEELEAERIARERAEQEAAELAAEEAMNKLRSPICCILGHVDTGKTSLLDRIRSTNVQGGEAGGITQQIGATFFPRESLDAATSELNKKYKHELKVPGLLVIDTPGHESFTNLRTRGSSLCDIAVLVVDIMHGLEPQTKESLRLLRERKCPYMVALNKVDRLLDWEAHENMDIEQSLSLQKPHVQSEFETRSSQILLEFSQEGINAEIYWRNDDIRRTVSVVPTSAKTGEGICDMLLLEVQLVQRFMEGKVSYKNELECTVLEVKPIPGIGTTIDVVLVNGTLYEGDDIMVCGLNGPIVTQIRALLTPQPMKELRVKGEYVHHKKLRAAIGVKIAAQDLDEAVPGTPLYVIKPGMDVDKLKNEVMKDLDTIIGSVDKSGVGVTVQSSTLGSMEALLSFLKESKIPVNAIALGPMHKRHMNAVLAMKSRAPKYAVVLAFDVPVSKEAAEMATKNDIPIYSARIIYHLFDSFTAYVAQYERNVIEKNRQIAVFPVLLKDLQKIRNKDPIIVGANVEKGQLHLGTPLCVLVNGFVTEVGRVISIELNEREIKIARPGQSVAIKINCSDSSMCFGRQFDEKSELISRLSRKSIDALKESFRDDCSKDEWAFVAKLKKAQGIL